MRIASTVAFAAGALAMAAACSPKAACGSLSDKDAVDRIAADYAKQPASARGDPAQMQFAPGRVRGIGRGQGLIQAWFAQDDHTLTVATLSDACQAQYRPGLAAEAIASAAIPTRPPQF